MTGEAKCKTCGGGGRVVVTLIFPVEPGHGFIPGFDVPCPDCPPKADSRSPEEVVAEMLSDRFGFGRGVRSAIAKYAVAALRAEGHLSKENEHG